MKNLKFYQTFTTSFVDGILIRQDKSKQATEALYYDHGRPKSDKWHQTISMRRVLNSKNNLEEKEIDVRDNVMTGGYIPKGIDECVYTHLQRLEMMPTDGTIPYETTFAMPFESDSVNKVVILFKWISGIQSITKKTVIIDNKAIKDIGLNMTVKKLWYGLMKVFKDSVFSTLRYNEDTNELIVMVGGRDMQIGEGPGFVKLKTNQYAGLLNEIVKYHEKLEAEKVDI